MGKPLLSVVVPTKDRYKYLKHLIKLIQSFNSDEWEVVVQDNTEDNTEIVEFLNELNYPGCKYFHEKGQLPMTTNADKAILHSEGEYVCFLGDDDGICPNAIDYCRMMKEKGYEAMRSNLAHYYWPDSNINCGEHGRLRYPLVSRINKLFYSNDTLMDVINRGFVDRGNLPSVYHGIASRKALNKIYEKCNTFFPGQSPDISNGVAMSLVIDKFIMVDDIVTISGASKYHGGVTLGMNKKIPMVSDMVWFRPNAEKIWDRRLPKVAEGSIIWAESSIETLRNMGREDLIEKVDFEKIYKFFVVYSYPVRNMVYDLSSNKFFLIIYAKICYIKRIYNAVIRRIMNKLRISNKNENDVYNIDNIGECVLKLAHEK